MDAHRPCPRKKCVCQPLVFICVRYAKVRGVFIEVPGQLLVTQEPSRFQRHQARHNITRRKVVEYHIGTMKPKPDTPGMAAFTRTMKGLLAVSHDELKVKMDAYEGEKKRRKAKRPSSRASNDRH